MVSHYINHYKAFMLISLIPISSFFHITYHKKNEPTCWSVEILNIYAYPIAAHNMSPLLIKIYSLDTPPSDILIIIHLKFLSDGIDKCSLSNY